ncbi:MAG: GNAT family N-acetyltransferase [Defluviitaleaceae bacterium]|nr:GNAT family N-acetyltransferase [Defluviitaleaceae bacterium]
MEISELSREDWQGHLLPFHYTTDEYYDVDISRSGKDFHVSFVKKPLSTPYKKLPDDSESLFQPWWDDIKAWGVVSDGKLLAAIETSIESWNKRLRVNELWVDKSLRRQGLARTLMNKAMERALLEKCRMIVLETQSCNVPAIDFYLNYGFTLVGFDAGAYQNDDLERKEVRMEFGIFLDEVKLWTKTKCKIL